MEASFGPAIAAIAALILVAGPLAVAVTKLVDLVRGFDKADAAPSWVWIILPMLIGVAICLGWGINLLSAVVAAVPALAEKAGTQEVAGQVLTGVLVGAMAGFWHSKMEQWTTWAKGQSKP